MLAVAKSVSGLTLTTFKVVPSVTKVSPGQTFTVDIKIAPSEAIAGAQFNLTYNPAAVKINSVTEGNLFKAGGASTFFMAGTINNTTGVLSNVAVAIITPGQTVITEGVIATISCTALTRGSSNFALTNLIAGTKDGVAVPLATSEITQVSVSDPYDLNNDGKVDINDLTFIAPFFGQTGTLVADVNKDGTVNILDMIMVVQHFS